MTPRKNSLSEAFLDNLKVEDGRYGYREIQAPYEPSVRRERIFAEEEARRDRLGESALAHFRAYTQTLREMDPALTTLNNHFQFAGVDYHDDSPRRRAYYATIENGFNRKIRHAGMTAHLHLDRGVIQHHDEEIPVRLYVDDKGAVIHVGLAQLEEFTHMDDVDDFALVHYGVKGMRWGIRKERRLSGQRPPSSLEAYRTLSGTKTSVSTDEMNRQVSELKTAHSVNPAPKHRTLTPAQKKALIGAGVVGGLIAANVLAKNIDSGDVRRLVQKGRSHLGHDISWKRNEKFTGKKSSDEIMKEVVHGINKNYGTPGTVNNCRRCTFTYEMRRRGFDVEATRTQNGRGQAIGGLINATSPGEKTIGNGLISAVLELSRNPEGRLAQMLNNKSSGLGEHDLFSSLLPDEKASFYVFAPGAPAAQKHAKSTVDAILGGLSKNNPEGARGEIGVKWVSGGAHSMAWEIINGKAVIFDTQSGKKYDSFESFGDTALSIKEAGFTRLDNIDLNDDFLLKWVKNAKH